MFVTDFFLVVETTWLCVHSDRVRKSEIIDNGEMCHQFWSFQIFVGKSFFDVPKT